MSTVLHADDIKEVSFFSCLGGVCPLIPLPLVDSALLKVCQRLMVSAVLENGKLKTTHGHVSALTREYGFDFKPSAPCLAKLCCGMCWWVAKKICFVLSFGDSAVAAATLFHGGWLLTYAIKKGILTQQDLESNDTTAVWRLREAIIQTCDEVNPDKINKAFEKLFSDNKTSMERSQSTVWEGMKKQGAKKDVTPSMESTEKAIQNVEKDVRKELSGVMEKVEVVITANRAYLDKLQKIFEDKYAKLANSNEKSPLMGR
mmetsp:Transcript_112046/g.327699  ORF Transcript_112046/g.327699 Transcript_112046/m.327699 type:complete len:259 (+) Transcript_112046:59-835(+)